MELLVDLAKVFGRIITILPLMLFITLLMGKRSIGELPVFDFLVILSLGAIVGADIADPAINHIYTAFAVVVIGLFQRLVSKWKIINRAVGRLLTFEPTIVVKDGHFLTKNMESIRYSVDNVLQMLREKDVFDVAEVKMAIVEANGNLSVHKKPEKDFVKREDVGLKASLSLAYPVVVEGKVYSDVLNNFGVNEKWLAEQLEAQGITDIDNIFFASINEQNLLHVSLKDNPISSQPQIHH